MQYSVTEQMDRFNFTPKRLKKLSDDFYQNLERLHKDREIEYDRKWLIQQQIDLENERRARKGIEAMTPQEEWEYVNSLGKPMILSKNTR